MKLLEIKNLHVEIEGEEILKGLNLEVEKGQIHALMGPNGSGKSTLANVLAGNPKYKITKGQILYKGEDITEIEPNERAKKGIFLSFQYPTEISGVTISNFLRTSLNSLKQEDLSLIQFRKLLNEKLSLLGLPESFAQRYLNQGFSGGEKKKSEILQMAVLNPELIILDETDSGLDIDSLRIVANGINKIMSKDKAILIITHYKRILEYINPDKLSIIINGKIAQEGTAELVNQLEEKGYGWVEQD